MSPIENRQAALVRFMRKTLMPGLVCGALCAAPLLALLERSAVAADVPQPMVGGPAAADSQSNAATTPAGAAEPPGAKAPASGNAAQPHASPSRYAPDRFAGRAGVYYGTIWGIDTLSVRLVQSGELVRFSYRIVDPTRARVLNDKQTEARLEDPRVGVSLVVPTMEKVGQLRQTAAPEAGRSYWMTFSNKGRRVARGDRVDVVIGQFRANNLIVD